VAPPTHAYGIDSLAVLPFVNMSGSEDTDYRSRIDHRRAPAGNANFASSAAMRASSFEEQAPLSILGQLRQVAVPVF
jgi:hypothetical protein